LFQTNITNIYPKELNLLQSNNSDDNATFLNLDIQIHNIHCTIKIYDKKDDFNFDIVSFPCLDGDVLLSPSYGTYMYQSQLIRFARVCNKVKYFNDRNFIISRKVLKQGFLYHKIRKTFAECYNRHFDLVKNSALINLIEGGISHPHFYRDFLKKINKVKYKTNGVSLQHIASLITLNNKMISTFLKALALRL